VHVLEQDTLSIIRKLDGHTREIKWIEYCSALNMVITGSWKSPVRVWDAATGECVRMLKGHTYGASCAAVHGTTYVNLVSHGVRR
jgi:WD40 repeat protein